MGAAILFLIGIPLTSIGPFEIGAADTIPAMLYQIAFATFVASRIAKLGQSGSVLLGRFERVSPTRFMSFTCP
jgi:hypothetical protein